MAVFFAGLSSLINLYETPIATVQEKLHLGRRISCVIVCGAGLLVAIFTPVCFVVLIVGAILGGIG